MSLSTFSGGSTTACAACKHQRKKCKKNCILARYFPQDGTNKFLNAHKLFGVSNITKMLKRIEESQRDIAMENLIYHANARALDPVGGVYRTICDLKCKIEFVQTELNLTRQQIDMCRSLAQEQHRQRQNLPYRCNSFESLLQQDGDEYVNVDGLDHQNMQQQQEMQQQQQNPSNYDMFLEMPEQTSKVKLEEEKISDQRKNNLMRQILMSSAII
ncbi:LOB domain-containing protein 7 [Arabidopsis thaliana]|uniref:LOB domain-containing protein 7 n=4 Tax=Arabidopsis TaxID=3701 RepID=LBD7_ARATH|nr:LOB domain-containing protein 7 [Arabidopsis thaliana]Q9SSM9.1 RecName: Full=LOB domain-containing protein 7; AltName: Full=ASYMMETRIC LEAVES 2-like protein 31; Short=AS2-like protein 31 [Arabidopsis thaliana]KAG7651518.1 Lateral organ boundaries LOB [Arabidopsis thaliana x Arabidopsis arenosa]KAG7659372.1 Lateral organ boundaries LOB [Arabidopsis suecica]AAD55645.1 Hypothetical protein [Arabidopsis thaliana]AEE35399.1 LOB domain-containing protein 7 [Arabidopsis thaliana]OAP12225.1 LBD7 [|eukprot:NP_177441.1 LOB domain-containing protein 7 [Arabidopsis thaliana]